MMGEVANKLSKSLEEIKRCAKALSIAISAAKKERTDEKKENHLKKINALIKKYNNANNIHKELCSKELNRENNPMIIWDDNEEEYTLKDLQ